MKCPNDKTEMELGFMDEAHWISGKMPKLGKVFALGRTTKAVQAFCCPNCGKIELYSEVKK